MDSAVETDSLARYSRCARAVPAARAGGDPVGELDQRVHAAAPLTGHLARRRGSPGAGPIPPVAQVERSVSGAASLEGPDVVERRALRRRLLRRQEGIEGRPPTKSAT